MEPLSDESERLRLSSVQAKENQTSSHTIRSRVKTNPIQFSGGCSSQNDIFESLDRLQSSTKRGRITSFGDVSNSRKQASKAKASKIAILEPSGILKHCVLEENPSWRGDFVINSQSISPVEGLEARLSSKSCTKVREVVCEFPWLMNLEMHPGVEMQPSSSDAPFPSNAYTQLCFFSENGRDDKDFANLLNIMDDQYSSLKARVDDVNLFLYSSRPLQHQYWRINGKSYLWAVLSQKLDSQEHQDGGLFATTENYTMISTGDDESLAEMSNVQGMYLANHIQKNGGDRIPEDGKIAGSSPPSEGINKAASPLISCRNHAPGQVTDKVIPG